MYVYYRASLTLVNREKGTALSLLVIYNAFRGTGVTNTLKPGYRMFYTWDDASKPRQFFAYIDDPSKAKQIEITTVRVPCKIYSSILFIL